MPLKQRLFKSDEVENSKNQHWKHYFSPARNCSYRVDFSNIQKNQYRCFCRRFKNYPKNYLNIKDFIKKNSSVFDAFLEEYKIDLSQQQYEELPIKFRNEEISIKIDITR